MKKLSLVKILKEADIKIPEDYWEQLRATDQPQGGFNHPDDMYYHKGNSYIKKFISELDQSNLPLVQIIKLAFGEGLAFTDTLDAFLNHQSLIPYVQNLNNGYRLQDRQKLIQALSQSVKIEIIDLFKNKERFSYEFLEYWGEEAPNRLARLVPLIQKIYGISLNPPTNGR